MPLSENRRKQLDEIVLKLEKQNAPKKDVQFIVDDFKQKFENEQIQPEITQKKGIMSFLGDLVSRPTLGMEIMKGVGKGLVQTGVGGAKLLEKVTKQEAVGITPEFEKRLEAKTPGEKIGKGLEKVTELFAPIPGAGKAKAAVGAIKTAKGLVGTAGKTALEAGEQFIRGLGTGEVGQAKKEAAIAGAFPVAGKVLGTLGKAAGEVASYFSSAFSGVPKEAILKAFKEPDIVRGAIREMSEHPELGPERILENAENAFNAIKQAQRTTYQEGLAKLGVAKENIVKTVEPIKQKTIDVLKKMEITVNDVGEVLWTKKTTMPKAYQSDLQEVYDRVKDWEDFTATGIDDLREVVSSYFKTSINPSKAEKQFNFVLKNVKNDIVDLLPENIKKLNKQYAQYADLLDSLRQELSLNKDKPVMAMRKLMNVFNPKSDVYRQYAEVLEKEGGKEILSDIAGLLMSKWTPEGLGKYLTGIGAFGAGMIAPKAILVAPLASPRVIGEITTSIGSLRNILTTPEAQRALEVIENAFKKTTAAGTRE